jgi:hypothetical protein
MKRRQIDVDGCVGLLAHDNHSHPSNVGMPDVSVEYNTRSIYHLLCRTFSQCIPVAQVIDFYVSNVVSVCDVHLTIDQARTITRGCSRRGGLGIGRAEG